MQFRVHQSIWDKQLVWSASYCCSDCGTRIEEDGWGSLPEGFRANVLETGGVWSLTIEETNARIIATKLLRKLMGWSLAEAAIAKKKTPGKILTGTQAEVERLKLILSEAGIKASIEREA